MSDTTVTAGGLRRGWELGAPAGAVCLWAAVIVAAALWGADLNRSGAPIGLGAPPLVGEWGLRVEPWLAAPIAVGAASLVWAPALRLNLGWRALLVASTLLAAAWALALGVAAGPGGLLDPVRLPTEYLAEVSRVGGLGDFLSHYTDRIATYNVHLRGHPPGMVLALAGLDRIGLGGAAPAAALMIAGGCLAVPAALIAMREVAGGAAARAAAPYLALAPAAIWIATSADALFAGVAAWSVALIVLATGQRGRRAGLAAGLGGILFGGALMLSYGMALIAAVPIAVAVARRRAGPLLIAAGGTLAVLGAFALGGFWWPDGLVATRHQYLIGIASERPFSFFFLNNLAAFALVVGPAALAALVVLRDHRAWLLAGGGLAAVALAELSGMSKGEVERIWLPFAPWVLLGCCALPLSARPTRAWLGAQAAVALAVTVAIQTRW